MLDHSIVCLYLQSALSLIPTIIITNNSFVREPDFFTVLPQLKHIIFLNYYKKLYVETDNVK